MNAEIKGRTRRKIKPGVRLLATLPILILFSCFAIYHWKDGNIPFMTISRD